MSCREEVTYPSTAACIKCGLRLCASCIVFSGDDTEEDNFWEEVTEEFIIEVSTTGGKDE